MALTFLAIIPDGNRRYAKKHNLSYEEAYRKGIDKVFEVCNWCMEKGIRHLAVWGFSTENWNRSKIERRILFSLFREAIDNVLDDKDLERKKIRIVFAGDISKFPSWLKKRLNCLAEKTKKFSAFKLTICLNYGGRAEILNAINRIIRQKLKKVNERVLKKMLWVKEEPDLIIRTSGEQRLSGFLPFQSVYSELYFCRKLWPEFSKKDFEKAIEDFNKRQRRFGK